MVVGGVAMSGQGQGLTVRPVSWRSQSKQEERERELSGNNNGGHLVLITLFIDYNLAIVIFRERNTTTR